MQMSKLFIEGFKLYFQQDPQILKEVKNFKENRSFPKTYEDYLKLFFCFWSFGKLETIWIWYFHFVVVWLPFALCYKHFSMFHRLKVTIDSYLRTITVFLHKTEFSTSPHQNLNFSSSCSSNDIKLCKCERQN